MAKRATKKSVGARIVDSLREFTEAVESGEDLTKRFTCRTIRLELKPHPYTPAQVKRTRELLGASQSVFARFIGVSPSAVQDWEQGAKPPKGSACRLMDEIRVNPDYWIRRLQELATPVEA